MPRTFGRDGLAKREWYRLSGVDIDRLPKRLINALKSAAERLCNVVRDLADR